MRITNAMMANTTLINISRNMRYLDNLTKQIESTKKIQVPSDDPIVASRALKFRTSVSETEQFLRNGQSGLAWMEITESSFLDITNSLLKQIRERCVEGATGTEEHSDKLAIVAELRELVEQIGLDMNQTYAGRYVFSGFRTDQPPILIEDNNLAYVITQQFNLNDIEKTKSFQKLSSTDEAVVHNVNILKLAYNNVDFNFSLTDENGDSIIPGLQGTGSPPPEYEIKTMSISDPLAYTPDDTTATSSGAYVVHYITETGELVFSDEAAKTFKDGTTVTYYKEGYQKGELNPLVYFDCVEVLGKEPPTITVDLDLQTPVDAGGKFTFGVNQTITDSTTQPPTVSTEYFNMNDINTTDGPSISINGGSPISIWDNPKPLTNQEIYPGPPPMYENTYKVGDIDIIQHVSVVNNEYKIDYTFVNYGAADATIELSQHMQTELGSYGSDFFYSGNPSGNMTLKPDDPDPTLALTVGATGGSTVDKAHGDGPASSYTINWPAITLAPDAMETMSTSYGVKSLIPENATLIAGNSYDMDNQYIQYEFATNTFVTVNSLAKNVYTDNMYADLKRLLEFAESLKISETSALTEYYSNSPYNLTGEDLTKAVGEQITAEKAQLNAVLHDRFNNMLYLIDHHASNTMKEHTQLGSRMQRLELLQVRLEEDEVSYTKLMSENEDTDMEKAIILKMMAEMAYQASLKAGANIVQMTLANFIG